MTFFTPEFLKNDRLILHFSELQRFGHKRNEKLTFLMPYKYINYTWNIFAM